MGQWKDISSFSQRQADRTPCTFQMDMNGYRLIVTRHIHHSPDEWVASCDGFFNERVVSTGSAENAKQAALFLLNEKVTALLGAIQSAIFAGATKDNNHE